MYVIIVIVLILIISLLFPPYLPLYFAIMSPLDLRARNASSRFDYYRRYSDSIVPFEHSEKTRLNELLKIIAPIEAQTRYYANIPWTFMKVAPTIEQGFPHTLGQTIMVSNVSKLSLKTLLHEKVHIFQRLYPIETEILINAWGFTHITANISSRRNNPDIRGLYIKNNMIPVQVYTSQEPTSLHDSETYAYDINSNKLRPISDLHIPLYITQQEHPYEMMAVILPLVLLGEFHDDPYFSTAQQWAASYF